MFAFTNFGFKGAYAGVHDVIDTFNPIFEKPHMELYRLLIIYNSIDVVSCIYFGGGVVWELIAEVVAFIF